MRDKFSQHQQGAHIQQSETVFAGTMFMDRIDKMTQTELTNTREHLGEHTPARSTRHGASGGARFGSVALQLPSKQVCVRENELSSSTVFADACSTERVYGGAQIRERYCWPASAGMNADV